MTKPLNYLPLWKAVPTNEPMPVIEIVPEPALSTSSFLEKLNDFFMQGAPSIRKPKAKGPSL
jgi:hypothetical protein